MSDSILDRHVAVAYRLADVLTDRLAANLTALAAGEPYDSAGVSLPDVGAVYAMNAPQDGYGYQAFVVVRPLTQEYTERMVGRTREVREDWALGVCLSATHIGTTDQQIWASAVADYCYAGITTLEQWAREEGSAEGIDRLDFASSIPEPVPLGLNDESPADERQLPYYLYVEGTYEIHRRERILLPTS